MTHLGCCWYMVGGVGCHGIFQWEPLGPTYAMKYLYSGKYQEIFTIFIQTILANFYLDVGSAIRIYPDLAQA